MNNRLLNRAEKELHAGNFLTAKNLYEEIVRDSDIPFDEKIDINDLIKFAEHFHGLFTPKEKGETFFPVVSENVTTVLLLKVSKEISPETDSDFQRNFTEVKELLANFLDAKLRNYGNGTMTVLDWGLDSIKAGIVKPFKAYSPDERNVQGGSVQLAMGVALISLLSGKAVGGQFVFSGKLKFDGGDLKIVEVGELERKEEIIRKEKPQVKEFVHFRIEESFDNLLKRIFGDEYFTEIIQNYVDVSKEVKDLRVTFIGTEAYFSGSEKTENVDVYKFEHKKLPYETGKLAKMNDFFDGIINRYLSMSGNIILDDLKPNFATGMFVPKFRNKISGFVAVRNTQIQIPQNIGYENAAIVVYKGDGANNVKIGEIIYFGKNENK